MPKITALHWEKLVQIFELEGFKVVGGVLIQDQAVTTSE